MKHLDFQTVLVATDLQEGSSAALRYAQSIAARHGARLVIVHVIDPVNYAFPEGDPGFLPLDLKARNELNRIEEDVRLSGISVHSVLQSGAICDGIVEAAQSYDADLLVLGTRAHSQAGRLALGTIARQLICRCSCPVLTVAPDAEYQLSSAGDWRRVLVATDFSEPSLAALTCAQRLVRSHLFVLHVSKYESADSPTDCLERLRHLAPMNQSHTVPVEHFVESGDISPLVVEYAKRYKVDLVVLGSPANALSSDELNSSTVLDIISRLDCPVLCFPRASQDQLAVQLAPVFASRAV